MAASKGAKSAKTNKVASKTKAKKVKAQSSAKLNSAKSVLSSALDSASTRLKSIKPAQVKYGFKFVFKWIAIVAIVFFFVGGPVLAAWMSNRDAQQQKKEQEEYQKQYEEAIKKAQEEETNKPKEYDETLKFGEITKLEVIDEKTGDGTEIREGDKFVAKYRLALAQDGEIVEDGELDKNPLSGEYYTLQKPGLIDGWVEGMIGMKVGGVRVIKVPSEKGYGESGQGEKIGPDTDLVFRIELSAVNPG